MFPIGGVHPVLRSQCICGSDLGGLVAFEHRVGSQSSLPLEAERFAVELARQHHHSVELEQFFVVKSRVVSDESSLRVEDL